jgi:hypothetical protein
MMLCGTSSRPLALGGDMAGAWAFENRLAANDDVVGEEMVRDLRGLDARRSRMNGQRRPFFFRRQRQECSSARYAAANQAPIVAMRTLTSPGCDVSRRTARKSSPADRSRPGGYTGRACGSTRRSTASAMRDGSRKCRGPVAGASSRIACLRIGYVATAADEGYRFEPGPAWPPPCGFDAVAPYRKVAVPGLLLVLVPWLSLRSLRTPKVVAPAPRQAYTNDSSPEASARSPITRWTRVASSTISRRSPLERTSTLSRS